MRGFGKVHHNQGNGSCQTSGKPLKLWRLVGIQIKLEDGSKNDAGECAKKVAKDQRAWLSQRDVDCTVAQNRRSALCFVNQKQQTGMCD